MKFWNEILNFPYLLKAALLAAALWQGVYGMSQLFGWRMSLHPDYPFTGSFYNPGPFACYLSLTFPLALYEFSKGEWHWMRWLGGMVITVDALLLPASMSRTAWIAALLGSAVAFAPSLLGTFRRNRGITLGAILVGCCAIGWGMYMLKPASADGRFLMWKVAAKAVEASPFNGSGWDYIAGRYGEAQEAYFAGGNGSEQEMMVADAPEYVFNEYLQVAIAYGWGWSALMTALLAAAFITEWCNHRLGLAGAVLASAVVMTASYPFQFNLSVVTIGGILLAAILSTAMLEVRILGVCAVGLFCIALLREERRMDRNMMFTVAHMHHKRGEWQKSNDLLKEFLRESADPMPLNIIGKNYKELGMRDSAEYYLKRSVNRCPNRLYPHYLLMKLYSDSVGGNRRKAMEEAGIILTMREKIPSPAVEEMRTEAEECLKLKSKK